MHDGVFNSLLERLRGQLDGFSGAQLATLRALFESASTLTTCLELIEKFGRPCDRCPHCAAIRIHRHGSTGGLQRYRCLTCRRTFNALTGTPFAFLRLRGKWLPFLQAVLDSRTVRSAAENIGIHRNTSFRWRHRFMGSARHDRPPRLQGIVEADETYLLESQKGSRHLDRPARRRGGKARRRGISNELDCILVARDRDGKTRDFVCGRGPVTARQLARHLSPVLAADVLLVSDSAAAYRTFARRTGILHEAVNLRAGVRVRGAIHLQHVNGYHSRFHGWLSRFNGVASKYLPNYLGWRHGLDGRRWLAPADCLIAALRGNDALS
ncbi:IS1595 family transposase [Pseudoduganella umbonata]|uniref:IS1595 family transposase n=1 Tax=Pseudoduganella umbonata TaxID=864828 RepID=A0A4P8HV81_9BURK|nr:transposase-like protein [Pseudoduganella umbonata]QCP13843.1 IS1595 family transposase [Pseudoduganella umbonata]